MELSPPLRWLGALAVMLVVVLIAVPMLLQTIGDTVVFGEDATAAPSETAAAPSEVASGDAAADEGGGGGGGGDEFPVTYEVVAGDTGTKISEQFYDTSDGWPAIAEANDIDPSAPLRVGLELTIPAPE
ncbi:MAG TPA: LysM domain-containing protein [Euzebyales bacterium]|nr:LysM domain-containing protein [Euzebyales bacterium]